ncbi:hypothetical protein ASE74_04255 [Pedobacter sp. Leaf216]|uniref:hypothetical protein n=1 Tax=Pedobacter sp. Leaf216 TaxID=1735684 RepID=UPI0007021FCB|nr:hypothetical protein [Pedobacter sp. Leaf216]KQM69232.1 hypothetical protein ASE74_04255 [Pedobacter sp. Leaf216]
MIELEYFFCGENGEVEVYQLIRFGAGEPWRIVLDGELLGSLENLNGIWRQLSGDELTAELFKALTGHIEHGYFNRLPEEICSRWPDLVEKVVLRCDADYMVICKEGISFKSFEQVFSKFIPGLLKDEWAVKFQVFSHDFCDDFLLEARPLVYKKQKFGWQKVIR